MLKMLRQDVIRQKTVLLSLLIIVLLIKIGWYIPVFFASVYIDNLNKITSYSVSFNPAIGLQIKMWSITMDEDLIKANCSHLILFLFNLIFNIVQILLTYLHICMYKICHYTCAKVIRMFA